jgi:nucleotide-binding universal stress UspA family protein
MRLLIAVDDSAHSQAVLRLGLQLLRASRFDQVPTILTVVGNEAERGTGNRILTQARSLAEADLKRLQTKVRIGRTVDEIVKETEEHRYDLLVIGMKPAAGLLQRWLGSTTMQIVEQVSCSVAIANGEIGPLRHLLVCDSGARTPSLLTHLVTQLSSLLSEAVTITVLHVMSQISAGPQVSGEHLRADAEELIREHSPEGEWLTQDLKILQERRTRATPKVRHGFVVDEILEEAHSGDYDLVVIGAHQQEGWTSFLLDNLARQITMKIDRPVLLVR